MLSPGMTDPGISIPDATRLADEYGRELERRQMAPTTVRIYNLGVRLLLDFARPRGIVNRDTVRRWQDDLRARMKPRSAALYGVSVKGMLQWAADNGECDGALARAIPPGKYERLELPRPLAAEHQRKIEEHLRARVAATPGLRALRDRALFYYVRATAARTGELLQVRRADVERATVRMTQRDGEQKVLAPPPGVLEIVRRYLDARTDDLDCLWVAVKPNGMVQPLADDGVSKVWERLARFAGVPRFTTRELRHTAGAMLAERGRDMADIMVHMGSKDIRAVQGYKVLVALSRVDEVRADLDVVP